MKQTFTQLLFRLFVFLSVFLFPGHGISFSSAVLRPIYHRVRLKENLFRISLRYHQKLERLQVWNNITDVSKIKAGQVLVVAYGPSIPNPIQAMGEIPATRLGLTAGKITTAAADSTYLTEKEVLQPEIKPHTFSSTLWSGADHASTSRGSDNAGFLPLPVFQEQLDAKSFIITILVILFSALALGLFLFVLSSRIYKIYCAFITNRLRKKYELLLMDVLFKEESPDVSTRSISAHFKKNYLQRKFNRQVLLTEIIHLHKNFSGDFALNLESFFTNLGFDQDSFKKLNSPLWHIKAQGISELAEMNIKTAIPAISNFIEHHNEFLRMEAQLAVLKLADEDVLAFLDELQSPLTDWQQLNLQQVLSHKGRHQIPEFSRWLTATNESIIEFSVKMTGLYNQVTATPQLIKLLRSTNLKIKIATVQALQKLDASDALPELESIYHLEKNKELRLFIIQALENIGFDDIAFYEQAITSDDFDISLAAAKALMVFKEAGSDYLAQLHGRADNRLNAILAHVLDSRI
jgi:hypothetical protein